MQRPRAKMLPVGGGMRTWGPSRESRRAEMRANTCWVVSLNGLMVSFLSCHRSMRCSTHSKISCSPSTLDCQQEVQA